MQTFSQHLFFDLEKRFSRLLPTHNRNSVVKSLCHHGYHTHHRWLKQKNMSSQLCHIPIQAQGTSITNHNKNISVDAKYVVHGKDIQINLIFRMLCIRGTEHIINQVSVGQHNTLSSSSCSRSEKNHCTLLRLRQILHRSSCIIFQNVVRAGHMSSVLKGNAFLQSRTAAACLFCQGSEVPVIEQHILI